MSSRYYFHFTFLSESVILENNVSIENIPNCKSLFFTLINSYLKDS